MTQLAAFVLGLISIPAFAQHFQPYYAVQWGAYRLNVDNPQFCEGMYNGDEELTWDWKPVEFYWDRGFRCLDARGAVRGYLRSSVTDRSISCTMSWQGDIAADQLIPGGRNSVLANGLYVLAYEIARPLRVRVRASIFLEYDALAEPNEDEIVSVRLYFHTGSSRHGLYLSEPGAGQGEQSFEEEFTISDGGIEIEMHDAHIAQNTAVYTGVEHFDVRAAFRMDVISCPGDIDYDNVVSINDLVGLLPNMGLPGEWGDGDFNDDGTVNLSDLTVLLSRFGSECDW